MDKVLVDKHKINKFGAHWYFYCGICPCVESGGQFLGLVFEGRQHVQVKHGLK